jgi:hypothetical protein
MTTEPKDGGPAPRLPRASLFRAEWDWRYFYFAKFRLANAMRVQRIRIVGFEPKRPKYCFRAHVAGEGIKLLPVSLENEIERQLKALRTIKKAG